MFYREDTEKSTNLSDFKIMKVIGKGGFGKVFLVQKISKGANKGNVYAMKSIRKDIILDYD
jgi:p70 ribosomal S6 kinase